MNIEQHNMGTVAVLKPTGPLTDEACEAFVDAVYAELEKPNPRLVLNMSEVPYVDSRGLEILLDVSGQLRDRGLTFKLALLPSTCREIFDLTELSGEFEIFDEVQDAVRSFI